MKRTQEHRYLEEERINDIRLMNCKKCQLRKLPLMKFMNLADVAEE